MTRKPSSTSIKDNEIRPSKEIWDYYMRDGVPGITVDLILSSLADINYGYYISYSASELLKDLELVDTKIIKGVHKIKINKLGRQVLARELHSRYHRKTSFYILIDPSGTKEL